MPDCPTVVANAPGGSIDPDLAERFCAPGREFGPTPLWWWSGEKVTGERIEWQMRQFAAGGVFNLVLINLAPAGPQFGAVADDPAWFSDEWWRLVEHACSIAVELDMRLWFYDQIGFSGANVQGRVTRGHAWAAGQGLRRRNAIVRDGVIELASEEQLIGAYADDGTAYALGAEGTIAAPNGDQVQAVIAVPTSFDYLNPEAGALLLDAVHGEFDRRLGNHLGTTIAGSFQDELPPINTWTPGFLAAFRHLKGYDLHPYLPSLFEEGSRSGAKVRGDYYAVRTHLAEKALFEPLGRWHADRGMLLGADQSNPARAGLPLQATQLYSDYPRTHRHLSAVGSDHEGDSKFHASLAKVYGHDRVWLEAFHSSGWGGTLEETWDWLAPFIRRGATLYNPHASYYSTVGGWFEWAPPSTDWRQPYWRQYPQFAAAVSRAMSVMTWGRSVADVAVLHPTSTMHALLPVDRPVEHWPDRVGHDDVPAAAATQDIYLDLVGKDDWFHWQPSLLDEAGIAFDIVDEDSFARSHAEDGQLRIGEDAWTTVVVPSARYLEQDAAAALLAHADAGGRVLLVGEAPRYAAGRNGEDTVVQKLAAHGQVEAHSDANGAAASLRVHRDEQYAYGSTPLAVRRRADVGLAMFTGAYPNATSHPIRGDFGTGRVFDYEFDRTRYASSQDILVRARLESAQVWDLVAGTQRDLNIEHRADGSSFLRVKTDGTPLSLVVWRAGPGDPAAEPSEILPEREVLLQDWEGELVPTMDNRWGDFARPVGASLEELQVWTVHYRREGGPGVPTWATLGESAHSLTRASEELPDPLTAQQASRLLSQGGDLAAAGWEAHEWSASRGQRRDFSGELGLKGRVPSEFVSTPDLRDDQQTLVRTIVATGHSGPADLVLSTGAHVRAWWNGMPVDLSGGYYRVGLVDVRQGCNLLEYRLAHNPDQAARWHTGGTGSGFSIFPPSDFHHPPEFMTAVGAHSDPSDRGKIAFSASLPRVLDLEHACLIVGSAKTATIHLGETLIGRQEKVEYYEDERGPAPVFFRYDVTAAARAGANRLTVTLLDATEHDALWIDFAMTDGGAHVETLVSGQAWQSQGSAGQGSSGVVNRAYAVPEAAFAVTRPHPLPEASWLSGPARCGRESLRFNAVDQVGLRAQEVSAILPAGAVQVRVPTNGAVSDVTIDGKEVDVVKGVAHLGQPLPRPGTLRFTTTPSTTARAGGVLTGPLLVTHAKSPIALGDWRGIGLAAWSGGVRYTCTVDLPGDMDWALDLGDVRGSVEVRLDGEIVGEAFCAPFSFAMPGAAGEHELAVTVFNTLGPFLHESTPTTWVFPSQLASGLFGPVTARFPEREAHGN